MLDTPDVKLLCCFAVPITDKIPLVRTGIRCSHFDEVTFGDELMTAHIHVVSIDVAWDAVLPL